MTAPWLWKVGSYAATEELAAGGQADVFLGFHVETGEEVVLKQLALAPTAPHYPAEVQRFQRVARIRVPHPVVVNPIAYLQEGSSHVLVEPFIEGCTLDVYCHHRQGRLALPEALTITTRVAEGLAAMHRMGIIHRDIKLRNVIITLAGEPRIIDLGISHVIGQPSFTPSGAAMGTPPYMAPEQVTSPATVDQRADVYALGMLLYVMLAGTTPFADAVGQDAVAQVLHQVPRPLGGLIHGIPKHIDAACLRCLAKKPEDRFPSAEAFIQALDGNGVAHPPVSYCPSCGAKTAGDARFCGHCGAGLRTRHAVARCVACGAETGAVAACLGCGRAFRLGVGQLVFVSGPLSGYRFRIPDGNYTVGRDALLSRDQELSRRQLHVCCAKGRVSVRDEDSANGCFLNGDRLSSTRPVVLRPNDELRLGRNRAIFQLRQ